MRVSISSTVSNVDPNTNFSLVNVITVAFYCCRSVVVLAGAPHPPNDINRHRTTALGAIKGDKPSLATSVAVKKKVALINNMESGIIFPLVENTILEKTNFKSIIILPRTLFPVSVVSISAIFSSVPFLTT